VDGDGRGFPQFASIRARLSRAFRPLPWLAYGRPRASHGICKNSEDNRPDTALRSRDGREGEGTGAALAAKPQVRGVGCAYPQRCSHKTKNFRKSHIYKSNGAHTMNRTKLQNDCGKAAAGYDPGCTIIPRLNKGHRVLGDRAPRLRMKGVCLPGRLCFRSTLPGSGGVGMMRGSIRLHGLTC